MNNQGTRMSSQEADEFDNYLNSLEEFEENSFEGDKLNITWGVENLNSVIRNNLIQHFTNKKVEKILTDKELDELRNTIQESLNILDLYTNQLKIKAKCVEYMFNEPPREVGQRDFLLSMPMSAIEDLEPSYFYNIPCIAVYNESGLIFANSAYLRITGVSSLKELKELANKNWEENGSIKNGLTEKAYHGENKQKVYDFVKTLKKGSGYQNEHFKIGDPDILEKTYAWSSFGLNNTNGSIRIGMDVTDETQGKNDEEIKHFLQKNYTEKRLDGIKFGFEETLGNMRKKLKMLIGDKFENKDFIEVYKKLNLFAQMGDTFFDKGPFIMNMWHGSNLLLANPVYTGVSGYTLEELRFFAEKGLFYSKLYGDEVERQFVAQRVEGLSQNKPHYNEQIEMRNKDGDWITTHFDTYLLGEKDGKKMSFRVGRLDPNFHEETVFLI